MIKRADRISSLGLSEIVQISEAAARMRREGQDILSLSTGEPDFPTPQPICDAAIVAMNAGLTKYTATAGTQELRQAVAANCGFDANSENVIISTGAKQVLFNVFLSTLNEGDEVIIPAPYWSSYRDIVSVAGGVTVEIGCTAKDNFKLSAEKLAATINPRSRWLLLNSPSNPSGAMYTREELQSLAEVLQDYPDICIVSDEIYQHISYTPFTSFRAAAPDLAHRTLIINGVSKAWSMTGWRIGWGIGPSELVKAMVALQGQNTSGASSISQAAALQAITGDQSHLPERAEIFHKRRDFIVKRLNELAQIDCQVPSGAFYVFPSCEQAFGQRTPSGQIIENDADLCHYLLESVGLAVVPGRAFGAPGHFRLSYAYSDADLAEGCNRLQRALQQLD